MSNSKKINSQNNFITFSKLGEFLANIFCVIKRALPRLSKKTLLPRSNMNEGVTCAPG